MRRIPQTAKRMPVGSLRHHPQNPNRGDTQAVRASIARLGFFGRIIVQRSTGAILAGNHTYDAAVAEGARTVPVWLLEVDDVTALKIMLVDNQAAARATTDEDVLLRVLSRLDREEVPATGYTEADIERMLGGVPDLGAIEGARPPVTRTLALSCPPALMAEITERLVELAAGPDGTGQGTPEEALERLLDGALTVTEGPEGP